MARSLIKIMPHHTGTGRIIPEIFVLIGSTAEEEKRADGLSRKLMKKKKLKKKYLR
jgi:hypothetical protein